MAKTETAIPKEIGRRYNEIPDNSRQVWANPTFSLLQFSQAEVARMWNDGRINDDYVLIIKFLRLAKFATADQISRALNKNVSDEYLSKMVKEMFLNSFILSEFGFEDDLKSPTVLHFYTLDFGGQYLNSIIGEDMTNWRYTDLMVGTSLIKKNLIQTELLISFNNSKTLALRDYKQFKELRIGNKVVKTDFQASFKNRKNTSTIIDFVGFVVNAGTEDVSFKESVEGLQTIFNATNAWKRYYPLGTKPHFLIVIEDSTQPAQIIRVAEILGQLSDFSTRDIFIVGANEITDKGLGDTGVYTYSVSEVEDERKVNVGKIKTELFK